MVSLGEEDVRFPGGPIVGHCRVRWVGHDSALYPRLRITLGLTLNAFRGTDPDSYAPPTKPLTSFRLSDLRGELRLREQGAALGILHWMERSRDVRAWPYPHEHQITLVCELDRGRLEALERHRRGGALQLSLALVPTFVQPYEVDPVERRDPLELEIRPFNFTVYQEDWTQYLQSVGFATTDLIEIRYDLAVAESFQRAVEHTRAARGFILAGDYNKAVAVCRKVWEVLEKAPFSEGAITEALTRSTHARRVDRYTGIVAKLKQLANLEVHDQAVPPAYSRREAQFVVGSTEFMIGLIAEGTLSE